MIYNDYRGLSLSRLGFGAMRLPVLSDGKVDEAQVADMVTYAMEHGVNYFDTAWPYHSGESERILGDCLQHYPREQYYLATKYPGHQISSSYDPAGIFEQQLKKCRVDYFDFYLLHDVCETSVDVYTDPKWGIIDYFVEQKRLGRIKHLGFSSHGMVDNLREFLDQYGDKMDFCQIQLNYLDWTLQDAKTKYELLTERGVSVWVMEPLRGGKLANLNQDALDKLSTVCPGRSSVEWALRFLQGLPNVKMILSGMSAMHHMKDNVAIFEDFVPLTEEETKVLFDVAEGMKDSIPCTACRYCCDGCPMGLDIPMLLSTFNEIRYAPVTTVYKRIEMLPADRHPSNCIDCGQCAEICPQKIDIPQQLRNLVETVERLPKWVDICKEREAAQKR